MARAPTASPTRLLAPEDCVLLLIDYQPQMAFAVNSMDGQLLVNNVAGLAKSARAFDVPTVLTTVAEATFSGPTFSQITDALGPNVEAIDRTTMNAWEDPRVVRAVEETGRRRLLLGGLWTEVCIVMPALQALEAGYDVFIVVDACAGTSPVAHEMAVERMIQAGAIPVTWLQALLEWQRDWAREATYEAVGAIVREHAGAYGVGMQYAAAVYGAGAGEGRKAAAPRRR